MSEIRTAFARVRRHFPSLSETGSDGLPFVFFDGPAGTQVPASVIEAMQNHLVRSNALSGGPFITSRRCSETVDGARDAMADFFNAGSGTEIVFGPNMTTLTWQMSRAIGRMLKPGDEIVVTDLDHFANVSPWVALEENGIVVHRAGFRTDDFRLDLDHLQSLLTDRTRLVAVGYASNLIGTISPVRRIADMAHDAGAWLYVDAVHYAPHGPIDVQAIDCDFLVCSVYKFFGPHVGALWGRMDLLDQIPAYRVEPADPTLPHRFESGMLNFEGLAGTIATIDYLAGVGREFGDEWASASEQFTGRRRDLQRGMRAIRAFETDLCVDLVSRLSSIDGLRIWGITDPNHFDERCPTVSFTLEGYHPEAIANHLAGRNIFVWDGNNYALGVTRALGLEESGGMVRVGLAHYNTSDDIERLITALREMSS